MVDVDALNERLRHANLGDSKVADYEQECLLCRRAIRRDHIIKAGARNTFSDELLWFHQRCADFVLLMYGRNAQMVDNGWRRAQYEQHCYGCHARVKAGNLIYRVPRWTDPADPLTIVFEWACPNCQRHDSAPGIS